MIVRFPDLSTASAAARGGWLCALLLACLPLSAMGKGYCSSTGNRPPSATPTLVLPTSLVVRPGTAAGTVVWSGSFSMPRYTFARCGLFGRSTLTTTVNNVQAYQGGYWGTGVPGLGWRFQRNGTDMVNPVATRQIGPYNVEILPETWTFSLVRTAEALGSGSILAPSARVFFDTNAFGNIVIVWHVDGTGYTRVQSPTCSVRGTTVRLGEVPSRLLPTIGATTPTSPSSNLVLSCTHAPAVTMRLTSSTVAGSTTVLPTTGTARGVGVQLMYRNTPMVRNQDYPVSTAAPAQLDVPVAGRYVRLSALGAGTANATAIVQFTYQ